MPYIAMAGLHGYLPNYSSIHTLHESAVEDLATLHELTEEQSEELRKHSMLELDIKVDGNEYCEITQVVEL